MRPQMIQWRRYKSFFKRIAYSSGMLALQHQLTNANRLTVVLFHRVLGAEDPRWDFANPTWTLTDSLFKECLQFFIRHYNPVGIEEILASRGESRLPPRPLLVTFDDGWADNAEYAWPLLRKWDIPATVFVVVRGIGKHRLWQEALSSDWRLGRLPQKRMDSLWESIAATGFAQHQEVHNPGIRQLIRALEMLEDGSRKRILKELCDGFNTPPDMLSLTQLTQLSEQGMAVGSHGQTHAPMREAKDLGVELQRSRADLETMIGKPVETLAFPHGDYDAFILDQARKAGYRLMFTSSPHLNTLIAGKLTTDVVGRISVPAEEISTETGTLSPELLALWLFHRPSFAEIT